MYIDHNSQIKQLPKLMLSKHCHIIIRKVQYCCLLPHLQSFHLDVFYEDLSARVGVRVNAANLKFYTQRKHIIINHVMLLLPPYIQVFYLIHFKSVTKISEWCHYYEKRDKVLIQHFFWIKILCTRDNFVILPLYRSTSSDQWKKDEDF